MLWTFLTQPQTSCRQSTFFHKNHAVWSKTTCSLVESTCSLVESNTFLSRHQLLSLATINTHFSRATVHISSNKILSLIKPSSNSAYTFLSSNIISAFLLCDKKYTFLSSNNTLSLNFQVCLASQLSHFIAISSNIRAITNKHMQLRIQLSVLATTHETHMNTNANRAGHNMHMMPVHASRFLEHLQRKTTFQNFSNNMETQSSQRKAVFCCNPISSLHTLLK